MDIFRRWIRRAIIHRYFPEIWYSIENWFSDRSGGALLEIGCGRGVFTNAIVQDLWKVTSLDPSKYSLQRAKERVKKTGKPVTFAHAMPENVPFEPDQFDAITCINFLEFSADPLQVLKEARRVLKPGGKGIVVAFRKNSFWALPWVASALRKDVPERPYHCLNLENFKELIVASGFSIDSYKFRARYLPMQPRKKVIPWPVAGAMIALVKKPMPGEKQVKVPPQIKGMFHKN